MKIILWIVALVSLAIFWMFRSFLPFMSWGIGSVEIIYNIPENTYVTGAWGNYKSYNCRSLSAANFDWMPIRRSHYFTGEYISPSQYKVLIPYVNSGICRWSLNSMSLNVKVKDGKKISPKAPAGEGRFPSSTTIRLWLCNHKEGEPENADMYQDGVLVINDELSRAVIYTKGRYSIYQTLEEKKEVYVGYYVALYSQYKRGLSYCGEDADGKQKIIYNATYDPDISIAP